MNYQEQGTRELVRTFLLDRKAQNLTPGTIRFYRIKLKHFTDFCNVPLSEITPTMLREFLLYLQGDHNPGGVNCIYRAVKAFFLWYEAEFTPDDFRSPIRKLKPPKVSIEPLDPVSLQDVSAMLKFCGARDRAILLTLLDTGARASELLGMNLSDINLLTCEILIRQGKGRKPRVVYLGAKSRKALRSYLKQRTDDCPALWVTDEGMRLTYSGLRMMLQRRAKQAGIPAPSIHSFRRGFAISMLRSGCDLVSLANLLGHSSLSCLQRYLKQTGEDMRQAHRLASPVDSNF